MPTVRFTRHLERFLDCPPVDVAGATVREALFAALAGNPRLRGYILDDQDRLRRHVTIFVGGAMIRDRAGLSDPVGPEDTVHVLQALSGG